MPSSSYIAVVKSTMEQIVATVSLKEFTNQRAGETAAAGGAATHPAVDDTALETVIKLAAAEVEEILGEGETDDWAHIKFSSELALSDMGTRWAIRMTDFGIQDKAGILERVEKIAKRRVKSKQRIHKDKKCTGWEPGPSGFDPFDEVD